MQSFAIWGDNWPDAPYENSSYANIWDDPILGNPALDAVVRANTFELLSRHFPNRAEEWLYDYTDTIALDFWNPDGPSQWGKDKLWNGATGFQRLIAGWAAEWPELEGFVANPDRPKTTPEKSPAMLIAAAAIGYFLLKK